MTGPLAIIGGGNMARAILTRAAEAGILPGGFVVADPSPDCRAAFPSAVETATDAVRWLIDREESPGDGRIMLAVKPQVLPEIARELGPAIARANWGPSRCVISILAGATQATIRASFANKARIVRVMPNTPALVGRGMAAMCAADDVPAADRVFAKSLFEAVGTVIEIDESNMDAFTALGGSGPAYVFLLAEAMAAAGERAGLSPEHALLTARETVAGAGLLLASSTELPAELRSRVTSKGGTTAAGLAVMLEAGLPQIVAQGVIAARDRGQELARMAQA